MIFNNFKIRHLNRLLLKLSNPKLRIGKFLILKLDSTSVFLTHSNEIYNNVNIEIEPNGCLFLRKGAWIGNNVAINVNNIIVGKYSGIHDSGTIIGNVYIGDYVMIAKNVFISSGKHHYDIHPSMPIKMQDSIYEQRHGAFCENIAIHDDVWIGVNCVIMPGVTVGKGAIIGSNSVVLKDIAPYTVVAGNPAKCIKQRYDFTPKKIILASTYLDYPYFYSGFNIEKEPLVFLDSTDILLALNKFSVCLKLEQEKYIALEIRALEDNLELVYKNQVQSIDRTFQTLVFDIQNKNKNLFEFQTSNFTNLSYFEIFEIKKAWLY